MPSPLPVVLEAERDARQHVRLAIRQIANFIGLRSADLARGFGMSRQAMSYRLTGRTAITADEVAGFARFFGIKVDTLYKPPLDALRETLATADTSAPGWRHPSTWEETAVAATLNDATGL